MQDVDAENTFVVHGEIFEMAPDLQDLTEFDWDDPKNIQMVEAEEAIRIARYGKLTSTQLDQISAIKDTLLQNSTMTRKSAFDRAWERVTGQKLG